MKTTSYVWVLQKIRKDIAALLDGDVADEAYKKRLYSPFFWAADQISTPEERPLSEWLLRTSLDIESTPITDANKNEFINFMHQTLQEIDKYIPEKNLDDDNDNSIR